MNIVQRAFFAPVAFGELTVNPFEVRWSGDLVALRPLEREIVLRLLFHRGDVVGWRYLARMIGFTDFGATEYGNVRSYVSRTRGRFHAVDRSFTQLETVAGQGFRWA